MSEQRLTESQEKTKRQIAPRESRPAFARSLPGGLHPILRLQRTIGNRTVGRLIQAKVAVSHLGDLYEHEEPPSPRKSLTDGLPPLAQRQMSSENQAVAALLARQPLPGAPPGPGVTPAPTWDQLQSRFERLTQRYLRLNQIDVIRAERGDLLSEIQKMWAEIGAPEAATPAHLTALGHRLDAWEEARADDYVEALEAWPTIVEEYEAERARLVASPELSDTYAAEFLDERYELAKKRKAASGDDLRWYDIAPIAHEMTSESHLKKGWEKALRETIDAADDTRGGPLRSWPWPEFKVTQLLVEGSALGPHQAIKSAIRHQVRHAVAVMIEMGETEANAQAWAQRALAAADKASDHIAERFAPKVGTPTLGGHKWAHRLHIAGKLTIVIDVGASVYDIIAAPPKERPKKIVVHASRIAGGLAGAGYGARLGARLGMRFGPVGAAVGGILGAIGGGFVGAWGAKKIATFIADEIWPPDDTYDEPVRQP
jgi:hypothetical protein